MAPRLFPAVTLVGASIDIPAGATLSAATLTLQSQLATTEAPTAVISAATLTGSAGLPVAGFWSTTELANAELGTIQPLPGIGTVTLGNGNSIGSVGAYRVTGNFSLTDTQALTITAPVQAGLTASANPGNVTLAVAGNLTIANGGTVSAGGTAVGWAGAVTPGGNVTLVANSAMAPLNASNPVGTIELDGTVIAYGVAAAGGGTLALYAANGITGNGTVAANLLAARVGLLAADTLSPANWSFDAAGSISLTGPNAVDTLGFLTATGGITLNASPGNATQLLTVGGPVIAGYGQPAGSIALNVAGNLSIAGPVLATGANGAVSVSATGNVAITGATTEVFAPGALSIAAGGDLDIDNAVIGGASVALTAPSKSLTGADSAPTGAGAAFSGGSTTIDPTSTVASNGSIAFDALTTGGTVAAAGPITAASVDIGGGSLLGGSLTVTSVLNQTGGIVASAGSIAVGSGSTGTAGEASSAVATIAGSFSQSSGIMLAVGSIDIWSGGPSLFRTPLPPAAPSA